MRRSVSCRASGWQCRSAPSGAVKATTSTWAGTNGIHTLGVLEAGELRSIWPINPHFNGEPVDGNSVLIKYTYYGDTDFNGKVDFDDYSRIDFGFNQHRTGWLNGDFDGNGQVDFDDYSLIDRAFNIQSEVLRPVLTSPGRDPRGDGILRSRI